MLDIKFIRENPEAVRAGAAAKNITIDIDAILALDAGRRTLIQESEALKAEQNKLSESIPKASAEERPALVESSKALKEKFKALETKLAEFDDLLTIGIKTIPNIADADTPIGPDESGNVVMRRVGELPTFGFAPRDHVTIGEMWDLIDSERATKVAGTRFTYLKGDLVLLQNALAQFAFSVVTSEDALRGIIEEQGLSVSPKPFMPIIPPLFIKPEVFERMARIEPRDERYHIPSDDAFLIGSAEHTLGPLHMDETLREADLPRRYVAYTPAFRREAGSYGKDTKGILRLHQFDKIEMESFTVAETSRAEQDLFVAIQEHLLKALRIPYQVVRICTGDMGGPDARQIDIECWMPGQEKYRETHTADLMTDYQARRLNTRVKRDGGTEFVHMNDATLMAMGRILIALIENFQHESGAIHVPEVLRPYMGGKAMIGGK